MHTQIIAQARKLSYYEVILIILQKHLIRNVYIINSLYSYLMKLLQQKIKKIKILLNNFKNVKEAKDIK